MRRLAFLLPFFLSAGSGAGEAGGGDFVDPFSDDEDSNYVEPLLAGAGAGASTAAGAAATVDPDIGLAGPPANFIDPTTEENEEEEEQQQSEQNEQTDDNDFVVDDKAVAELMGLEGGLIKFEGEAEAVPFASLTPTEKRQVIADYKAHTQQLIPQENERQVLAQIRAAGSVEDFIRERANSVAPAQALTDDQVMQRYVEQMFPTLNPEQRTKYIDQQKTGEIYSQQVAQVRQHLTAQEQFAEQSRQRQEDAEYVQVARNTVSIADLRINDEARNRVLANILEPSDDDPTVSRFIRDLEKSKSNLYEAAFMFYEGRPLLKHYAAGGGPAPSAIESAEPGARGTQNKNTKRRATFEDPYAE